MGWRSRGVGGFGMACLGVLGVAGIGNLGAGLGARAIRPFEPSPADIVASRFLSDDAMEAQQVATYTTASMSTRDEPGLFNPNPSYPTMTASVDPGNLPASDPASLASVAAPATITRADTQITAAPSPARRRVAAGRPNAVLNDGQIASIRARLNLTRDQAQMWPAVEAALRSVSYTRSPGVGRGATSAFVDPNSAEVQQLKAVAIPLIMRLNDEQRQEVKMMAHVMGLGSLVAQF